MHTHYTVTSPYLSWFHFLSFQISQSDTMTDISSDAYERILDQSGQFGFYQKRTYFLICALQAVCVSLMAYTVYACEGQEPCPIRREPLEVTTNPPTDNFRLSIYVLYDNNVSSLNYTTKADSAPTSVNRDFVSKIIKYSQIQNSLSLSHTHTHTRKH